MCIRDRSGTALAKTQVTFFYPVQVGGPLTKIVDGYVAKFLSLIHISEPTRPY
mgnify:CR=1 FL=1